MPLERAGRAGDRAEPGIPLHLSQRLTALANCVPMRSAVAARRTEVLISSVTIGRIVGVGRPPQRGADQRANGEGADAPPPTPSPAGLCVTATAPASSKAINARLMAFLPVVCFVSPAALLSPKVSEIIFSIFSTGSGSTCNAQLLRPAPKCSKVGRLSASDRAGGGFSGHSSSCCHSFARHFPCALLRQ
jgi:hypothetical protein